MSRRRNACPLCGGQIVAGWFYQFSREYKILASGKKSKRYEDTSSGPMETSYAICKGCGEFWSDDDFRIDEEGYFLDLKHDEEEGGAI